MVEIKTYVTSKLTRSIIILSLICVIYFIYVYLTVNTEDVKIHPSIKKKTEEPEEEFEPCECEKTTLAEKNWTSEEKVSTCSDAATAFGPGQKVITFSLYAKDGSDFSLFTEGIEPNLEEMRIVYPGWIARIYTDDLDRIFRDNCDIFCKYDDLLFWCDVKNIPRLGNMGVTPGRSWRFLTLGDPLVDIFISRDLDSRLSIRERAAIIEWENSSYPIHVMRDHEYHNRKIMAGMWGANNRILGWEQSLSLQQKIFKEGSRGGESNKKREADQNILAKVIYDPFSKDIMAHDSYFCEKYPNDGLNIPFPIQRKFPKDFVGNIYKNGDTMFKAGECPKKCRKRKKWTRC